MTEKEYKKAGVLFAIFAAILVAASIATCISPFSVAEKMWGIIALIIIGFGYLIAYINFAEHGFGDKALRAAAIGMVYAILLVKWAPDATPAINIFYWMFVNIWTGTATFLCIELVYALAALASK